MEKGHSTVKKVFTVIGNVIIWLFVIFAAVVTIFTFAARSSEDGVPAIGGTAILTVNTDSMAPTFSAGDIILGKKLLPEEQTALKVDDIITFDAGDLNGDGIRDLNSHRIVEITTDAAGNVAYRTNGDNTLGNDENPVKARNVICKYTGTRIPGVGKVLAYLQTPTGFLLVIVLPLILFFIYELIRFIRKFFELKGTDKSALTAAEEERIRQQAVEEYLRQQAGDAADKAEKVTEKAAEAVEEAAETVEEATDETPAEE